MNFYQFISVLLIILPNVHIIHSIKLTDVTVDLFHSQAGGYVAAFGDFNADKMVDIFVVNENGTKVDILQGNINSHYETEPYSRHNLIPAVETNLVITSIVPADFNGDAFMDLLITRQEKGKLDGPVQVQVYYGQNEPPGIGLPLNISEMFNDQPSLIDWNGDMLPDLLAETASNKERAVWIASQSKNFTKQNLSSEGEHFVKPQSNAFIDINDDFSTDIVMTTEKEFEIWTVHQGDWTINATYSWPDSPSGTKFGQSSFIDMDKDGYIDHLIPACSDSSCTTSMIYIYSKKQWSMFVTKFSRDNSPWGFIPPDANEGYLKFPITLRFGDYNMDGYTDAIAFLQAESVMKAVLLQNVACSGSSCGIVGRTFSPDWSSPLDRLYGVVSGGFFDFYEDGVLDMILVTMATDEKKSNPYPEIRAYKQTSTTDACFTKITVTTGRCYKDCPGGRPPYGVNVPGPTVKYQTTSVEGEEQRSTAGQLSQTSHFALQLPFTLFGLGQTPNFVDNIEVGIPLASDEILERSWTQIIPNSQLVVVPHPIREPKSWIMKLFVTPSRMMLMTGASLIGTMGFVAAVIGILHWIERREDIKEKKQESHKFHFDAM